MCVYRTNIVIFVGLLEFNFMQSLTLYFIKILVNLFALLPMKVVYAFSNLIYFFFRFVIHYRKKVIHKNLQNSFPNYGDQKIKEIINLYYRYLSELIVEYIKGLSLSKKEFQKRFIYKNPEIFDTLFSQGKSAILLGSHYGNWEWGSLTFPLSVKHQVIGIYKPIKNHKVENYLNNLRKKWGLELASMKNAGRAIIVNKSRPVIYVFIADQTPVDVVNAHWVEFLHQDTPFLHGASKLAHRTGYPVFHYKINRKKRGNYEVEFKEIILNPKTVEPIDITRTYTNHLEKMINNDPTYWLWSHRRWKRKRPTN